MSLLSLAKFIPIVSEAFRSNKYYKPAQQAAQAQIDPNSPMFQNLYKAEKQQGQDDLAFQIAELQRQNRKATTMGRTPLFNAERGGETLFRGMAQGTMHAGDAARQRTYGRLQSATPQLFNMGQQQQQSGLDKAYGVGGIVDALRSLFNLE